MTRWRSTATTWARKTVALLRREHELARNDDERWLASYDAGRFIHDVVGELRMLVPLLHEDQIDEALREARKLADELRAHRLVGKLGNVAGRTGPEAEAFRAKAASLAQTRS